MRLKLKTISATITCALGLIAAGATLANPDCPSANVVRRAQLVATINVKPNWYLVMGGDYSPVSVDIYVKAKNLADAYNQAVKMQKKVTNSWTSKGISEGVDSETGKNMYYCEYHPYANVPITDNPPNQEFVGVEFESDGTAVLNKKMFIK